MQKLQEKYLFIYLSKDKKKENVKWSLKKNNRMIKENYLFVCVYILLFKHYMPERQCVMCVAYVWILIISIHTSRFGIG